MIPEKDKRMARHMAQAGIDCLYGTRRIERTVWSHATDSLSRPGITMRQCWEVHKDAWLEGVSAACGIPIED